MVYKKLYEFMSSNYGKEPIWRYHILSVIKYSKKLSSIWKADKEIVLVAALLHDIGRLKKLKQHNISGQEEAKKILTQLNYPKEKIEKVKYCIRLHSANIKLKRKTPEANCLAQADILSQFDNIDFLFFVAFTNGVNIEKTNQLIRQKLEYCWKHLDSTSKKIINSKYEAIKKVLR
jgi:uncharacterized protein